MIFKKSDAKETHVYSIHWQKIYIFRKMKISLFIKDRMSEP